MAQGRLGRARSSASYRNRVAQQQAVLDQLRSGGAVTGARPANPIIGMLQNLTGVGAGAVPNLYAAQLDGQEVLLGKGGWNQTTAATGPLNVGGRTWYPAQKGKDLVYRPATEAGQYGSILPAAPPAAKLSPEERAYEQERSRIAQLTEQNPELQRYEDARELAIAPGATPEQVQAAEDIGMRMWAQANKKLARAVKPGQAGYDVIQQTLIGQDAGNAARQGMGYQMQSQMIPTPPPGLNAPQGFPSFNMQPTYGAGGLEVDAEMRKKFQALINQTKE